MNEFINKVGHDIKAAALAVAHAFARVFGSETAKQFGQAALELLKSELGKIVLAAVEAASTIPTDGAGKREVAFKNVLDVSKKAGIEASDSLINLLIEICVQALKGTFGPKPDMSISA